MINGVYKLGSNKIDLKKITQIQKISNLIKFLKKLELDLSIDLQKKKIVIRLHMM